VIVDQQALHFLDRDLPLDRHMKVLHVIVIIEPIVLVLVVEAEVGTAEDIVVEGHQDEGENAPGVR